MEPLVNWNYRAKGAVAPLAPVFQHPSVWARSEIGDRDLLFKVTEIKLCAFLFSQYILANITTMIMNLPIYKCTSFPQIQVILGSVHTLFRQLPHDWPMVSGWYNFETVHWSDVREIYTQDSLPEISHDLVFLINPRIYSVGQLPPDWAMVSV